MRTRYTKLHHDDGSLNYDELARRANSRGVRKMEMNTKDINEMLRDRDYMMSCIITADRYTQVFQDYKAARASLDAMRAETRKR